ncbi:hypothetical protein [Salinibacterium sp.]|uniref:hypothetical protein n=1 Tax=Salinibacterium sp. TaxID=1915057 RepID=UPI00286C2228|nr:hypothetical protein [Salinibacterium sp.]
MSDESVPTTADLVSPAARRSSTDKGWIWVLVFLPLVSAAMFYVLDVAAVTFLESVNATELLGPLLLSLGIGAVIIVVGGAVLGAFGIFSARRDYLQLCRMQIERPFRWAWQFTALVGVPVYAIGRAVVVRRRTGRGLAVLVMSIVANVLAVVFFVAWLSYKALALVLILTFIATEP